MTKITNTSPGVRVINAKVDDRVRSVPIPPGETIDAEPIETNVFKARVKSGVLVIGGKSSKKTDDKDEGDKDEGGGAATFEARHNGGGVYAVRDVLGNKVIEGMTKADAEAFNTLSEKEKAEMVEASRNK